MLTKRNIVFVSLGLFALMAVWPKGDLLRTMRAQHVRQTAFISAGNRRLAGFFDGLVPDPRFDARKALRAAQSIGPCRSSRRTGLFGWLPAWLERTAHAQQPCQPVGRSGCSSATRSNDCTAPDCGNFTNTINNNNFPCQGTDFDGGPEACVSDTDGCQSNGTCNWQTCDNSTTCGCGGGGGTGCTGSGGVCLNWWDCCSGSCVDYQCQSVF